MSSAPIGLWIAFGAVVAILLAVDLGLVNRRAHRIGVREAAIWSAVWVSFALAFGGLVYATMGADKAVDYLTGWLIEKSLSVDNLFVFLVIFGYFGVGSRYQHRVLFWGILGAIVLRAVMIFAGVALIERFQWLLYVFGAFLVYTGYKLAFMEEGAQLDPSKNRAVRLAKRIFPMSGEYDGQRFFTRVNGKRLATPLLLVLVTVETSDVMFALDSIPAIFGITTDPFILYTSNIFAILGLRALYFLLADFMDKFRYLDTGLAIVLGFIGVKMLLLEVVHIPTGIALGVVALILTFSVVASLRPEPEAPADKEASDGE